MARAQLTYGQWVQQFGRPQSSSFFSNSIASENKAGYAAYQKARQGELGREAEEAALNSPAAVAQRRSEENFQQGLDILGANQQVFAGLGQPGDPSTQALINQELEFGASAANRAQNVARRQAAASGLGRGGGLDTTQRLIQEQFNRQGISAMRDIRGGLLQEGRLGASRANELAAQAFFGQGFQLPESGQGVANQSAFPNFNFAFPGQTTTSTPTLPTGGTQFKGLTKLPTTAPQQFGTPSGQRSFTTRRF